MSFETTNPELYTTLFILFSIVMIGIAVWSIFWQRRRGLEVLQKWADANGYELIEQEERPFRRGPFVWSTARGQLVYYVTVRDHEGTLRKGWVRCGTWSAGLFSDKSEVRWDEPSVST